MSDSSDNWRNQAAIAVWFLPSAHSHADTWCMKARLLVAAISIVSVSVVGCSSVGSGSAEQSTRDRAAEYALEACAEFSWSEEPPPEDASQDDRDDYEKRRNTAREEWRINAAIAGATAAQLDPVYRPLAEALAARFVESFLPDYGNTSETVYPYLQTGATLTAECGAVEALHGRQ